LGRTLAACTFVVELLDHFEVLDLRITRDDIVLFSRFIRFYAKLVLLSFAVQRVKVLCFLRRALLHSESLSCVLTVITLPKSCGAFNTVNLTVRARLINKIREEVGCLRSFRFPSSALVMARNFSTREAATGRIESEVALVRQLAQNWDFSRLFLHNSLYILFLEALDSRTVAVDWGRHQLEVAREDDVD